MKFNNCWMGCAADAAFEGSRTQLKKETLENASIKDKETDICDLQVSNKEVVSISLPITRRSTLCAHDEISSGNTRQESSNAGLRQYNKLQPYLQAQYRKFDKLRDYARSRSDFEEFLVRNAGLSKYTAFQAAQLCDEPINPREFGGVLHLITTNYFGKASWTRKESNPSIERSTALNMANQHLKMLFNELKYEDTVQPATLFAHLAENGHQVNYSEFNSFIEQLMCGTGLEFSDFAIVYNKFVKVRSQCTETPQVAELSGSSELPMDDEFRRLFE